MAEIPVVRLRALPAKWANLLSHGWSKPEAAFVVKQCSEELNYALELKPYEVDLAARELAKHDGDLIPEGSNVNERQWERAAVALRAMGFSVPE